MKNTLPLASAGNRISVLGIIAVVLTLSGCLESTDVTFFEPGVYQGAADPLIGNSDEAALRIRFAGQTDR